MAVAQFKFLLEPIGDLGGLDFRFELAVFQKALFAGQRFEFFGRLAGFGLDVVEVGLEGHGIVGFVKQFSKIWIYYPVVQIYSLLYRILVALCVY